MPCLLSPALMQELARLLAVLPGTAPEEALPKAQALLTRMTAGAATRAAGRDQTLFVKTLTGNTMALKAARNPVESCGILWNPVESCGIL